MKPRYLYMSFSHKARSLKKGGLKFFIDLEKWKTFNFPCLIVSLDCSKRDKIMF